MFHVVELLCALRVPRIAVLALISIGFAGCSADMSTRLPPARSQVFPILLPRNLKATASVHRPGRVTPRELPAI